MNSVFQPYSYYMETDRRNRCDKYQHQPSSIHVWSRNEREGGGGDIKRKGNMEEKKGRYLVRKLKKNI